MAWKTMPNGAHVDIDKGETPTEAFDKQAGTTTTESHQRANSRLRNVIQVKHYESKEKTERINNIIYKITKSKANKEYKPKFQEIKKPNSNKAMEIDLHVEAKCKKILSGKIETKNNGIVEVREKVTYETGFQHIAKKGHDLTPYDIEEIRPALMKPDEFIPAKIEGGRDAYVRYGIFGRNADKTKLIIHIGPAEIRTVNGKEKKVAFITAYASD